MWYKKYSEIIIYLLKRTHNSYKVYIMFDLNRNKNKEIHFYSRGKK